MLSKDYGFRTSLAKEVEGQMSIVTQLPNVSAQSRAFISGRLGEGVAFGFSLASESLNP